MTLIITVFLVAKAPSKEADRAQIKADTVIPAVAYRLSELWPLEVENVEISRVSSAGKSAIELFSRHLSSAMSESPNA